MKINGTKVDTSHYNEQNIIRFACKQLDHVNFTCLFAKKFETHFLLFIRITSNRYIKANTSTLEVKIFSQSQLRSHLSLYNEIQGAKFSHFNRNLGVWNFPVQTLH